MFTIIFVKTNPFFFTGNSVIIWIIIGGILPKHMASLPNDNIFVKIIIFYLFNFSHSPPIGIRSNDLFTRRVGWISLKGCLTNDCASRPRSPYRKREVSTGLITHFIFLTGLATATKSPERKGGLHLFSLNVSYFTTGGGAPDPASTEQTTWRAVRKLFERGAEDLSTILPKQSEKINSPFKWMPTCHYPSVSPRW